MKFVTMFDHNTGAKSDTLEVVDTTGEEEHSVRFVNKDGKIFLEIIITDLEGELKNHSFTEMPKKLFKDFVLEMEANIYE